MNLNPIDPCGFCCGASALRSRGGHDVACPAALRLPVATTALEEATRRNRDLEEIDGVLA